MDDKDKAQLKYDMNNTVRFTVVGGKYQEFATQYPNFPFFFFKGLCPACNTQMQGTVQILLEKCHLI